MTAPFGLHPFHQRRMTPYIEADWVQRGGARDRSLFARNVGSWDKYDKNF
jgi:hypothetical protein